MLKVNLKKLYYKDDFEKENIDINDIKKLAGRRSGIYKFEPVNFIPSFDIDYSYKRAKEIATCQELAKESSLIKTLFINNFVFLDDEKFVLSLKKLNIDIDDLQRFMTKLYSYKKDMEIIGINYTPIIEIKKFYNIKNNEIILNKLYELFYFREELFNSKVKVKRAY